MGTNVSRIGDSALAARLRSALQGEVRFGALDRGLYSTDASIYQIEPLGVVVPKSSDDVAATLAIARDEGVPVLPRGAGTSQGGQAIGEAIVVDTSKYLRAVRRLDAEGRRVVVEPGVVLDELNRALRPSGLFFPVDVATASRATIGGMAGNNSAGARSIRYGLMVDNVSAIEAVLADGTAAWFGPLDSDEATDQVAAAPSAHRTDPGHAAPLELVRAIAAVHRSHAAAIERVAPRVLRHVAGYNLTRIDERASNLAPLLVGSEGTLAFFTQLELELQPLPAHKVLGVCHFASFRSAMQAVQHLVALEPAAVELVDRKLIELAGARPAFRGPLSRFVRGEPAALLLVEFAGEVLDALHDRLDRLDELMGQLGHPDAVHRAIEPAAQAEIWSVRKAGLNIVMSMKGDAKPVSFIEDCAVPLEHLDDYTAELGEIFERHGVESTWYAHASVGCLHVRPTLNLREAGEVAKMRSIAEATHALVRRLHGSHSGEHGDGLVRSEFLGSMLGQQAVEAFEQVKSAFDPTGMFNPGKIVHPPRMDDRRLFRYGPDYASAAPSTAMTWPAAGGLPGAVEMCNNNGACRQLVGSMCPSYQATLDETHTTRGRANALRLALSGQLGEPGLDSRSLYEALDLCVGCKACRRECPTGVDMARMKIEFLSAYRSRHGVPLRDRLFAYLPRYAPLAARLGPLARLSDLPPARWLRERLVGVSARRRLPVFTSAPLPSTGHPGRHLGAGAGASAGRGRGGDVTRHWPRRVALFVDTFSRYFEPDNARAAMRVLGAAGYDVELLEPPAGERPLCCGRTFLSAGLPDEARVEGERLLAAAMPLLRDGVAVAGIEPSCLLTLRDELPDLLPGTQSASLSDSAVMFEELLMAGVAAGDADLELGPLATPRVLVHGHCHRKAFGALQPMIEVLRLVPELQVEPIAAGCCGMAGSFGYEAEHMDMSLRMAELALLPQIRQAEPDTWIVADGTSCRRQILDGSGREAIHPAVALARALPTREA